MKSSDDILGENYRKGLCNSFIYTEDKLALVNSTDKLWKFVVFCCGRFQQLREVFGDRIVRSGVEYLRRAKMTKSNECEMNRMEYLRGELRTGRCIF